MVRQNDRGTTIPEWELRPTMQSSRSSRGLMWHGVIVVVNGEKTTEWRENGGTARILMMSFPHAIYLDFLDRYYEPCISISLDPVNTLNFGKGEIECNTTRCILSKGTTGQHVELKLRNKKNIGENQYPLVEVNHGRKTLLCGEQRERAKNVVWHQYIMSNDSFR
ncbi:hypothetical protein F511_44540 [Dorcoceras hygrometricum]|uniref:Uncharacterized protein n=1 Tax=Dorcoceras hygrometricum TaxID=472368 RepID=A0A2Z6ZXQ6_9LAMI|nr:hypothetical protein F511_44540 [Dorcoceras hygrometricum]